MPLLDQVISVVRDAGRAILEVRASTELGERDKGSQGPVTLADHAADFLLRDALPQLRPAAWLSEETADDPVRLDHDQVWIVDPLDGTKEFIAGLPEFAISVGLVNKGRCVLGVIHQPVTGQTWWAEQGGGAYLDGKPVRAEEGHTLLASRSETRGGEFSSMTDWAITPIGSIALKLAYVASGNGSVTISRGPKWEWDVCAGALIVAEAGGQCTDMFGGAFNFNKPHPKVRGVVAGAPNASAVMLAQLAKIGPSERMREEGLTAS
jgi:myo-inositol-1(or 4)-monophosphatase